MQHSVDSWLKRNDVSLVLFDLDDTIIETDLLFRKKFDTTTDKILSHYPQLNRSIVREAVSDYSIESYKHLGGNLYKRWPYVVDKLVHKFNLTNIQINEELYAILISVYDEVPKLRESAHGILAVLAQSVARLGLVTHGNEKWTQLKLEGAGIAKYFEKVFVADENGFKTHTVWRDAISYFSMSANHVMVVGDNIKSDIQSAHTAGVRKLFWVRHKNGWKHAYVGDVPSGVVIVASLKELLHIVLSK